MDIVEEIENMTESDLYYKLQSNGINQNSRDWHDYESAKRIIFNDNFIDPKEYNRKINWITDYLGL